MRNLLMGLMLLSGAATALADMRCNRSLVGEGDSQYEVISKCGEPVYQQWIRQPVYLVSNTYATVFSGTESANGNTTEHQHLVAQEQQPVYREIERWTYNLGAGKLLREVDFYNGEVIGIRTGGRAR